MTFRFKTNPFVVLALAGSSQCQTSGSSANRGLDFGPGGKLVAANRPLPFEVLVEMEVEMAVHADGIDRAGTLKVEGVIAAAAQLEVGARGIEAA